MCIFDFLFLRSNCHKANVFFLFTNKIKILKQFLVILATFHPTISEQIYVSEFPMIPGTENDIVDIDYSSIMLCSLKCSELRCHKILFNEAGEY